MAGAVMGIVPGTSNDRSRKEKKMRCTLNVEDLPYDAMGDYSAFRLEYAREGPKEEVVRVTRDAGADPAVSRKPLPGQGMSFMKRRRT